MTHDLSNNRRLHAMGYDLLVALALFMALVLVRALVLFVLFTLGTLDLSGMFERGGFRSLPGGTLVAALCWMIIPLVTVKEIWSGRSVGKGWAKCRVEAQVDGPVNFRALVARWLLKNGAFLVFASLSSVQLERHFEVVVVGGVFVLTLICAWNVLTSVWRGRPTFYDRWTNTRVVNASR